MLQPFPFAIESYQSRALRFSAQRCVNYFAEVAPGKKTETPAVLYNAPGTKSFLSGLAGAVRGAIVMDGVLYVLAGQTFYSVNSAGTATNLGTINTTDGLVSMAQNTATLRQLCFVDGTDGWIYDTTNGLQQIVDGDFVAADTVTFQDGYFIFNQSGTSNFFISALNDGLTYTATDFANAEGNPDNVVAVFSNHRELWVFGEVTIEVYYNSGNADFPFERIAGAYLERGCAAAFSVAAEDNTLFWLADDKTVRRAAGYVPERISTHAIEEQIRKMTSVSDAFAYFITISGHKLYHLTFPTGGACFVFDVSTGLWHERESYGQSYYRSRGYVKAYGKDLVGDAFQGRMGELDIDTFAEYGETMQGILTGPPISSARSRVTHKRFEAEIESGVGDSTTTDPQVWLDWSDDGGRTFSIRKPFQSMGKKGEYTKRLRWNRLGSARQRIYRLTVADPVKRSILGTYLDAVPGSS